jgi:hypothetical protein
VSKPHEVFVDGVRYVPADSKPVVGRAGVLAQIHRMYWGVPTAEVLMLERLRGCYVQVHDDADRKGLSCLPVEEFVRLCQTEEARHAQ